MPATKRKVKVASRPHREPKPGPVAIQKRPEPPTVPEAIEQVLIGGDLTLLSTEQRLELYKAICKSLGLNPLTRPFDYIAFKETEEAPAKLVLYARRDCTDQLRKIHHVSVTRCTRVIDEDFVTADVEVRDGTGRTDTGTGVVPLTGYSRQRREAYKLKGRELANAIMKAETKAKRRATLSICGLGILDESELDTLEVRTLTPGGRIIDPQPERNEYWCNKHNCDISKCPSDGHTTAENEQMERMERERKLSPAQREVVVKKREELVAQNLEATSGPRIVEMVSFPDNPNGDVVVRTDKDVAALLNLKRASAILGCWLVRSESLPAFHDACRNKGIEVKEAV